MNTSFQQSLFGRSQPSVSSKKDIKVLFRKKAHLIIKFCNNYAKKYRPRNQNQRILFPGDYRQELSQQISKELKEYYQVHTNYSFLLSRANIFIDNYHLKIIEIAEPIPNRLECLGYGTLSWFAEWIGKANEDYLVGVTDLNWLIIVSIRVKTFFKYHIKNEEDGRNKQIVSVNGFGNFIFIFTKDEYHLIQRKSDPKGQVLKFQIKMNRKIPCTFSGRSITKGYGIVFKNCFVIFTIINKNACIWKPLQGILSVTETCINLHQVEQGNVFLNFTINLKGEVVTILLASKTQIVVKGYNVKSDIVKNIGYIAIPVSFTLNPHKQFIPYLKFISRQHYLLSVIGFRRQLVFMRIWPGLIQVSRRVKCNNIIESVDSFGLADGIVVVLTNDLGITIKKTVIVTKQSKIASYSEYVNFTLMQKYTLEIQLKNPLKDHSKINSPSMIYQNKQVLFLQQCSIQRVVLNKWQTIYNQMKATQNIKLLKFLILLKLVPSPFLQQPYSFDGLENFFTVYNKQSEQILTQYYYIMNMIPSQVDILNNMLSFIPFILQHKIDNLPKEQEQKVMDWCLLQDQRLVEQMIVGGAQCGWEYAIKNGWTRAFRVMVQSGMEIQMPILKLYSMALFRRKEEVNPILGQQTEYLKPQGQQFLSQMVQYIKFVLSHYFKDLIGDGKNIQFKQIFFIVLKPQIWNFMIKFAPKESLMIIFYIFMHKNCIKEVNNYNPRQIRQFKEEFKELIYNYPSSNAEITVSHLSQTFKRLHPNLSQQLAVEHSKFVLLKFLQNRNQNESVRQTHHLTLRIYHVFNLQNLDKFALFQEIKMYKERQDKSSYFSFKKEYLKTILIILIKSEKKVLKEIFDLFEDLEIKLPNRGSQNERQCQMSFFLVSIWLQIFVLTIQQTFHDRKGESTGDIRKHIKQQTRSLLSDIEEGNYESYYLLVHLRLSINTSNEYTLKIFKTYLKCTNSLLKSSVFEWLKIKISENTPLQQQFIRRLKEIIEIDKEQSRFILESFFQGRETQIIKKLDHDPNLQLQYVQLVLQREDQQVESYYTNLHISLLLKLEPEKLIEIFKDPHRKVEYDISDALKMIESSKSFNQKSQLLILLYQMEGQISLCINTYLISFEQSLMKYIEISQQNREYIPSEEDSMINMSKNNEEQDLNNSNKGMINFLFLSTTSAIELNSLVQQFQQRFIDLLKLIYRQVQIKYEYIKLCLDKFSVLLKMVLFENYKFKKDYINLVTTFFGNYIIEMFENDYLHYFSQWIQKYQGKFQFFSHLQSYVIEIYNKVSVHLTTLKGTSVIQRKNLIKQIKTSLNTLEFCISSNAYCEVCKQEFKNKDCTIEAVLFNCGHLYHSSCIEPINGKDFCYFCVSMNQYKSMMENQQLNLVDLLEKFKLKLKIMAQPGAKIDIKQKQTLLSLDQKRGNRLRLFDKKVSSIETQAEIIDLKMVIAEYYDIQAKK